jgi:YVTN family beta-propeller protein
MAFRGNFAYVAQNSGVVVLDVKKYIVVDTITVGTNPQGIAIRGAYAYVADSGVSDLYVIDTNTNTLVTTIALPNFATDVHIVKDLAYVTEVDASLVSVIDLETNQVVDEIVLSLIDNSVGYGYLYGNSLYVLTNSTVQILNVDTGAVSQVADPFATVYIPLMVAVAPFVYDMNQFNLVNQAGIADAENILTQSGLSGTNNH